MDERRGRDIGNQRHLLQRGHEQCAQPHHRRPKILPLRILPPVDAIDDQDHRPYIRRYSWVVDVAGGRQAHMQQEPPMSKRQA